MKLILDTNFVLVPLRYSLNLEFELNRLAFNEFFMLKECLLELMHLDEREKIFGRKMLLRLDPKIIEFKNKKIINEVPYHELDSSLDWSSNCKSGYCDEAILKVAKEFGFAVATLDKKLMLELVKNGVRVVTLSNNVLKLV